MRNTNVMINNVKSKPYSERMAIAKLAFTEPQKTSRRGIQDLTPWELSEIDVFQNRNRGFNDDEDEQLENNYYED